MIREQGFAYIEGSVYRAYRLHTIHEGCFRNAGIVSTPIPTSPIIYFCCNINPSTDDEIIGTIANFFLTVGEFPLSDQRCVSEEYQTTPLISQLIDWYQGGNTDILAFLYQYRNQYEGSYRKMLYRVFGPIASMKYHNTKPPTLTL